jgi:hypothetical protein
MQTMQVYISPKCEVIEMTSIHGMMEGIGEGSTEEQLSRRGDSYDDESDAASRHQRTVWDEDEEQ